MQDKTEGEFFIQRLWTPSAGSNSPPPWLSRIRASPARNLRHYFFHFWPLVQTLGRGPTIGSPWSSSTPPSLGRGRVAPPPGCAQYHTQIDVTRSIQEFRAWETRVNHSAIEINEDCTASMRRRDFGTEFLVRNIASC